MRIGIFGGTFNPIHKGHIAIARHLLSAGEVDEVWFVVSPRNPFKQNDSLADDRLRLEMVRRAIEAETGMVCSDYEFRLPQPSYTWLTLACLRRDYPRETFVLLIGADNWTRFAEWSHTEDILAHHHVVVYPRRGCKVVSGELPRGVVYVDFPLIDISATDIRARIVRGESVEDMVPSGAMEVIEENKMYEKT